MNHRFKLYLLSGLLVLGLIFSLQGCAGSQTTSDEFSAGSSYRNKAVGGLDGVAPQAAPELENFARTDSIAESNADFAQISEEAELPADKQIIKNAHLSLIVEKPAVFSEQVRALSQEVGGFIAELSLEDRSQDVVTGRVSLRVPAKAFDESLDRLKKLAVKVEQETISAQDVTEEFVDSQAQLKNLQAQEEQYQQIMKQAKTIEDILKVAQKLREVRTQIDQIKGRLKYLSRQVEMSTINIQITSEEEVEVLGIRWKPLYQVKKSFQKLLSGLTNYFNALIAFAFSLPVFFLWSATVLLAIWALWKLLSLLWFRMFRPRKPKSE